MLFATHLVGGYISSRVLQMPIGLVLLGAALPDIIDKPLGVFEIAPHYHTVGHSIFTILLLLLIGIKFRKLIPLIVGWSMHIFQDALHIFINRGIERTTFVFYPLMFPDKPKITNGSTDFVTNFWSNYLWTTSFYVEFIFWGIAIFLLYEQREFLKNCFHEKISSD